jgi:hypothetical protein
MPEKRDWESPEEAEPPSTPLSSRTDSLESDLNKSSFSTKVPTLVYQTQGAGLDVNLQAGMFQRLPLVEIATKQYKGILTINLVLPHGTVLAEPAKWIWAALLIEVIARMWGFLV